MTISMPSGTLPDNVHTRFRVQLTLETIYNKQHGKIYYAVEGSTSMASRVDHSWV